MTKRVRILIEAIVALLEDGQWHSLAQVRKDLSIDEAELSKIIDFFKKFDFIDVNEKEKKVKLDSYFLGLPV